MVLNILNIVTAPLAILYWTKWIIAYLSIRLYNYFRCRRFDLYDVRCLGDPVKLGYLYPQTEKILESPYPESHLQKAADEVCFYGVNSKSECLLVRISRGCQQVAESWIYLKMADGRTFHLSEPLGYQQPFDDQCQTFSCGRLEMHYLAPMRKWRIVFNGMLKETSQDKKDTEETFVKFVFLWRASSHVYDLTLDTNPEGFASAMARSDWKTPFIPPIKRCVDALNFYAQSGVIDGEVSVNDGPNLEMYLFGEKIRSLGKSANIVGCKFTNFLGNIPSNGSSFHLGKATAPKVFHNLPYGYVNSADGSFGPVKELDIVIEPTADKKSARKFKATFTSNSKYCVTGTIHDSIILYSGQGWSGYVEMSFIEFQDGYKKGKGIFLNGEHYQAPKRSNLKPLLKPIPATPPLAVQFTDELSHYESISGGKGSSLGKLTQLSQDLKTFIVPKGLIVTTEAYSNFLTPEIIKSIKRLEAVACGNIEGDVKTECNNVANTIINATIPNKICHSIIEELKDMFGDEINMRKFAVRSSATGEDTATMSAAGQMDTFLGTQGLKEIFLAVKKCWASQFGHIAVEYKRRNGQLLNCPMAVVIQEMVACEVSGVLFTCDPVTSNPALITITANYGLGETVVAGSVEPDTITLRRKEGEQLVLESINIGAKHQKIVMKESGGVSVEDLDEDSKQTACVSNEMCERLAKLAIKIEKYYKSSRDIEWGILRDEIYILQSRPVTNISPETEYEMKHEFDAPLRCENEYYTAANVGEVMPLAMSPLGMEVVLHYFSVVIKRTTAVKGFADTYLTSHYYPTGLFSFCNHCLITVVEMLTRYGFDTHASKGFEISVFGRQIDDPELREYTREKTAGSVHQPSQSLRHQLQYYLDLFFHDIKTKKTRSKLDNYHFNFLKTKTAAECFDAVLKSCSDFDDAVECHIDSSESSSNWNMYMFQLLCKSKGTFDTDVYSDFARLLSSSSSEMVDVESADVPKAMQEVAYQIEQDMDCMKFKSMDVQEALQWLQTTKSPSGHKFRQFIKRHGHRCLNEFDVKSVTWGMDPKILVKLLQNLAGVSKEIAKKDDSYEAIFADLQSNLDFVSKCLLRLFLPNCRRAVRGREAGKACSIKAMDNWRKGYRHLADLMVSEGRLPEKDLIFFLTLNEINDLIKTRSPGIISRAAARKRVFPKTERYKFPEIMKGLPKPVNDEDESADTYEFVADLTMKGFPVSQGVAKGYARVALTLDEAAELKPGEILITYSTDIGWSPYFPIVSGVVTELGGLISHGAVVSREYGLPCVVGLQGATKKFRTGDYVLLDGKKGILQRLPQPEN